MPPSSSHSARSASSRLHLLALLLLFVGSGCAALIYEIVWFQFLRLVIGSSAVSLAVLLGTFMGGMGLGALLFHRCCPAAWHPLRVYAVLELLIGLSAALILWLMPWLSELYVAAVGYGMTSLLMRGAVAALCLLPPTMCMGATLPAVARWVELTPRGVAWLGFFYGGNIVGAVCGCLLTGFYLLRVHDATIATGVGIGINLLVFALGWMIAWRLPARRASISAQSSLRAATGAEGGDLREAADRRPRVGVLTVVTFLSGLTALATEVIWTRQLSLLLGASVYTFSIILAVFLAGLGVGSTAGAVLGKQVTDPRWLLAASQALLAAAMVWGAMTLHESLPYWPLDPTLSSSPWIAFQLDLMRSLWAMFPAAVLWGASFPLTLAAAAPSGQEPSRLVGKLYAANTLGAITGALAASLYLIPQLGSQLSQGSLVLLASVSAACVLLLLVQAAVTWQGRVTALLLLLLVLASGFALRQQIPALPPGVIAYGRYLPLWPDEPAYLYHTEGINASIAVSQNVAGERHFHVSGKVVASSDPADMRLQRMLGHFPSLFHGTPKSVLVVGCGAGVTAGSFLVHPTVERVVICEIEPRIPQAAGEFFADENHAVMSDPRVEIVYDDARHFIATTDETFDIITSDPIHPWVKGAAALYSAEYYELCRKRLNAGGYITQWVPLYESNAAAVKSEVATFLHVFPHGTVWGNDIDGEGYDVIMLAPREPIEWDLDAIDRQLQHASHQAVRDSLSEVGFESAFAVASTYAGDVDSMQAWLADAELNRDATLRLQYLAGLALNQQVAADIYNAMLEERRYPDHLWSVTEPHASTLRHYLRPRLRPRRESPR